MKPDVTIVPCLDYSSRNVEQALESALSPFGGLEWVTPGMRVAIKVNLVTAMRPERSATTHPQLICAFTRMLTQRGAQVVVGDSPGGLYNAQHVGRVYAATGMTAVESAGGVLNRDFSEAEARNPRGTVCRGFRYTAYLDRADVIINFCKLKSHGMMALSCGAKNMFGAIPGTIKPEYHFRYPDPRDFARMIVDLDEYFAPRLTIVDAVVGMEGDGPSSGQKREVGVLFASEAPYRLDRALCKFIGMPEERVPTIAAAVERGVLPEKGKVDVIGDPLPEIRPFTLPKTAEADFSSHVPGFLRGLFKPVADKWLTARPVVGEGCVGCGKCAESCPAHTIRIVKGRAVIDKGGCIRCFCCHEMCPIHVIDIRQNPLLRL